MNRIVIALLIGSSFASAVKLKLKSDDENEEFEVIDVMTEEQKPITGFLFPKGI